MNKVAIIGASGYTGIEMLRLVLTHPNAELVAVTSRQYAGKPLSEIFPRFSRIEGTDLTFIEPSAKAVKAAGAEYAFLALPHGVAAEYATELLDEGIKVIDLSADFRLDCPDLYEEFYGKPHPAPELLSEAVYGMPELYADEIKKARLVASPGCFPTSSILPVYPLIEAGIIKPETIVINSLTGVSGAGRKEAIPFLFAECNESMRAYGVPRHRHLSELEQEFHKAAGRDDFQVSFIPHLVPVTSGLFSTIVAEISADADPASIAEVYETFFKNWPLVRVLGEGKIPDSKHVTRTNFLDIGWCIDPRTNRVIIHGVEDNLVKGSGGQSIQAFNLMAGLNSSAGLILT